MRFAIVGAGGWAGQRHVDAVLALGHQVVALIDPADAVGQRAMDIGAAWFESLDALDLDSVDAVTLALPPEFHPEATKRIATAGRHVLCEKPMAPDLVSARDLAAFARDAGVTIMPGYMLRCHAHLRAFAEALPAIGRLRRLSIATMTLKTEVGGWRTQPGHGGVMLVNGIHQLDIANWLAGSLTVESADFRNVHFDMPTEDYFSALLRGVDGCSVRVESAWSPFPPQYADGMWTTPNGKMRIEAEGDAGAIVLTAGGYRINKEVIDLSAIEVADPFVAEFSHFIDTALGRAAPWMTVYDNLRAQELAAGCRRMYRSDDQ
ncbi:Gfo/Idh/MocA family protein [Pelagibacterium lacus]|nr:Gfo/Idh/MocA family oxidoreductase [Pelagibacterium lacus]